MVTTAVVLADIEPVPSRLEALVSAHQFGEIIFQKRRVVDYAIECLQRTGDHEIMLLRQGEETSSLARPLLQSGLRRVLHMPTWLAPADPRSFCDRIQRMLLIEQPCIGMLDGVLVPVGAIGLDAYVKMLPELAARPSTDLTKLVGDAVRMDLDRGFVDLRDPIGLIDLLSGAFSSRHFNRIERSRFHLRKFSSNTNKIQSEYDYYNHIPPEMQRWLVMPYDLRIEDGKYGSYKMERLLMLDMGQQWVNGSVTVEEFERFLEDIFGFFDVRARRSCSQDKARQNFEKLYVEKVKHRKLDLEQLPVVSKLRELMNQTSAMDSYERVFEAYFDLAADVKNELPDHECIGHGDPCFSNILYDKRIRLLRLIDPRGAADRDALWGDPHYDFAKLSHSVLGGYDYIVNGLYQLNLNADLRLQLTTSEKSWLAYAAAFTRHLEGRFIDVRRIRILEASLFLSLLPLHQDVPRNLAAFLLIAAHILREVERQ